MKRLLSLVAIACLLATAVMGCKAEGEIGDDVSTNVTQPQ